MDDKLQHREYTHAGVSTDLRLDILSPGFRTNILAAGEGYVWAWIEFDATWLNGKRINITSEGSGTQTSYIVIMDGSYNRSDADQFYNATGTTTGLVLQGNGILQTIRSAAVWNDGAGGPVNDTAIAGLGSALEDRVSLFFISRATTGIATASIEVFYLSVQTNSTLYTEELFDGTNHWEADASDPRRYGYMELGGVDFCLAAGVDILNPSAYEDDGLPYVFASAKYYDFNASWDYVNITRDTTFSIHFSDGFHNINISFTPSDYEYNVDEGGDYVQVPGGQHPDNMDYNSTTRFLSIVFPIYFKPDIQDARNVQVYQKCNDAVGWEASGFYFHIYSKGGYIERDPIGNGTFTPGGDFFEMCAWYYGMVQVNITYRMIQHFHTEFAHRFYKNDSGTWVPEDQAMQSPWHDDGGEDYGGIHDWEIRFKIHAWDNESQIWNNLFIVSMYMIDGDEGANDEWTAIKTYWSRGPWNDTPPVTTIMVDEAWNAFIEEEPAARYRTWMDLFISKDNSSGVISGRTNAYYHGIQDTGWWMWGGWAPMLNNISESIANYALLDWNGNQTYASQLDLMKLEVELEWNADSGSQLFMSCIEDINIKEFKLGDTNQPMTGVNTPIFVDAKSPDVGPTGFLAPLYSALTSLAGWITGAISAVGAMLWGYLQEQIPWFTGFWETIFTWLSSAGELFFFIAEYLIGLFQFGVDNLGLLVIPIQVVIDTYDLLVTYVGQFLGTNPSETVFLLVMIVVFVPFIEALTVGDTGYIYRSVQMVWGVTKFIIDVSITFTRFIVDTIMAIF